MYLHFPISPKKHYGLVGFEGRSGVNISPVGGHSLSEQSPSQPLRVPVLALVTKLQELPSPCMKICLACSRYALVLYQAVWRACSLLSETEEKKVTCILISTLPFNYHGWKQLQNYEAMAVNFSFETLMLRFLTSSPVNC